MRGVIHSSRMMRLRAASLLGCLQVCVALFGLCCEPLRAQGVEEPVAAQKDVPMAATASPSFEVATVRPSNPDDPQAAKGWSFESEGHRIQCRQATVLDILSVVYGVQPRQIVGGPDWLAKARYDVTGVPDVPGVPNPTQIRDMYKKLLAEHFALTLHQETREISIYALVVAKGGPLLKPARADEPVNTGNSGSGNERVVRFTKMSMPELAKNLTFYEDRPVVDRTGLPGEFDFTLRWTLAPSAEDQTDAPPSLFTAIKEQLGLQLVATKGPAEVIVIDHLERPRED